MSDRPTISTVERKIDVLIVQHAEKSVRDEEHFDRIEAHLDKLNGSVATHEKRLNDYDIAREVATRLGEARSRFWDMFFRLSALAVSLAAFSGATYYAIQISKELG